MTISAQKGIFGFGGQSAKATPATTWYRHKAMDVDLSPVDDTRLGPPEVGATPFPTIPYKGGTFAAGGALINPRLEDTLGWLLQGMMGGVTTTADSPEVGMNSHLFRQDATDPNLTRWMGGRVLVPNPVSGDVLGIQVDDAKIVNFVLNLPNNGLVTARMDLMGINWSLAEAPVWTWDNTFEDYTSIPVSCIVGGSFKVPGFSANELPVVAASIAFQNAPLDIRQEMVYGSPYLDNVTVVGRTITADVVLKWEDPNLYQTILTNSGTGTTWSPIPFVQDLEVIAISPDVAPAQAVPYKLKVAVDTMMWSVVGGIRLAGNQSLMLRLNGVGLEPTTGNYAEFTLENKVAAYAWPT